MPAIDAHAHPGECCVLGLYGTEEEMIREMTRSRRNDQQRRNPGQNFKKGPEIAELCALIRGAGLASLSRTPREDTSVK